MAEENTESLFRRLKKDLEKGGMSRESALQLIDGLLANKMITPEQAEEAYKVVGKKESDILAKKFRKDDISPNLFKNADELLAKGYTTQETENILAGMLKEKNPDKRYDELREIARRTIVATGRRALPPASPEAERPTPEVEVLTGEQAEDVRRQFRRPERRPEEPQERRAHEERHKEHRRGPQHEEAAPPLPEPEPVRPARRQQEQPPPPEEAGLFRRTGRQWQEYRRRRAEESERIRREEEERTAQRYGRCPDEVLNIARYVIRRMPETSAEKLTPVFLAQPRIRYLIDLNRSDHHKPPDQRRGISETTATECFWQIYSDVYRINPEGKTTSKTPLLTRGHSPTLRRLAGWRVPNRGMFGGGDEEIRYKIQNNPLLRASINKGRRILQKAARAYYLQVLQGGDQRIDELKKEEEKANEKYKGADALFKKVEEAENRAIKSISAEAPVEGVPVGGKVEFQQQTAATERAKIKMQEAKSELDNISTEVRNFEAQYDPRNFYNNMMTALGPIVDAQAKALGAEAASKGGGTEYWRYGGSKYGEAGLDAEIIKGELAREADYLARYYGRRMQRRFRGRLGSIAIGMRNVSMGTQTFGESWTLLLHNIWNLFFGPWTTATILVLIQFFFTLSFVGYNIQLLWVMPLIGAIFTFFINFSDSKRPLDWVTHFASGAAIGYSAMLFMVALNAQSLSFIGSTSSMSFWIVWIILAFLGIFQFYQSGGYKTVLQGSIIILLLAYLALGPYQAYYHQVIDQAKAPIEIAYRAGERAVMDVYLLATNPTEWYARQQVTNVRPERPLAFPKGVEIATLEALPPSVPGGQQFALATVIKNDGVMENATDITLSIGCNQWCYTDVVIVSPDNINLVSGKSPTPGKIEETCITCTSDGFVWCTTDTPPSSTSGMCVKNSDMCSSILSGAQFKSYGDSTQCPNIIPVQASYDTTIINRLSPQTRQAILGREMFYIKDMLKRGEAELVNVRNFVATYVEGRAAEANFARVYFNLSYGYSTSSSLLVSVISKNELERRFTEGETVFKQVTAVSKTTPAQVSINVGPQPLQAGSNALLLVGVSNTRDDSKVVLEANSKIIIRVPHIVAEAGSVKCDEFGPLMPPEQYKEDEKEKEKKKLAEQFYSPDYDTIAYVVPRHVEVLAYEFQSIFAFVCSFRVNPSVNTLQTGLVTVEMPYTFRLEQKKDIPVTPPLGIIYEPFEATCAACGTVDITSIGTAVESALDVCTRAECVDITKTQGRAGNPKRTCYYEYAGQTITQLAGTACHVCGSKPDNCEKFLSEKTCKQEASVCGWSCQWIAGNYRHPISNVDLPGRCVKAAPAAGGTVALTGPVVDKIRQAALLMKPAGADEQVKAEGIANSFEEMILKLAYAENSFRHCTDGTLNCINDNTYNSIICSLPISDERSSCGAMQIAINKHTNEPGGNWKTSTTDYGCGGKGAYDVDCNIRLGIGLLIQNYNQYGANGNPNPACSDEPYRSKYISYRGWKAALRAYNGWGCPRDYPDGQDKAGNFVENVIAVTLASVPTTTTETCLTCNAKNWVWCTTSSPSQTNGVCILTAPCTQQYPNMITSPDQCSAQPQQQT